MSYARRSSGLGVAPLVLQAGISYGVSAVSKLFGTGPPEKPFPWRWDKPGGAVGYTGPSAKPGYFGIVFGTQHQFFRVWSGSVQEVFGRPGFDVSGTIDGGRRQWRAYVTQGRLQLLENFGSGWVPVFAGTQQQMMDWTEHRGPITPTPPPTVTPVKTLPVVRAGIPTNSNWIVALLIAVGLAGILIVKE